MNPRRALALAYLLSLVLVCLTAAPLADAQVSVLTQRNDLARDGLNANETILTLSAVNANNFGKFFNLPTDGFLYAQPLYVANVAIPGQGTHNVVYLATEHNSIYAYDADGQTFTPLWQDNLTALGCPSGWTCTAVPASDNSNTTDLLPEVGITSTPVIDLSTNIIYVVTKTREVSGSTINYVYRLHALDIASGAERTGSPVIVQGSVPGNGTPSSGGRLLFDPAHGQYSLQRPALALVNGAVYIGFGSWGDDSTWHGWIFGYGYNPTAGTFTQTGAFSTTPNGSEGLGGVWMSGAGPASDAAGNLYFTTGNGAFDGTTNFGDTYLKLATPGLTVADYFTPHNQSTLDSLDLDVSSGAVTLLPDGAGTAQHPHIMIGCGKHGAVYVIDRDNMGHFNSSSDSQIIQALPNLVGPAWDGVSYVENCYSTAAYWQGHVYFGGISDTVKMFNFSNGLLSTSPVSQSATQYQFPGASVSVSANGSANGIVWTIENSGTPSPGDRGGTQAILHAYDATNLASELYNSGMVSSDNAGLPVKFTVPTIANGKVYVGTQSSVAVYGLLSLLPQAPAPTFNPPAGTYATAQSVTLTDSLSGATIYYTTDGSTPNTSSTVYSGPIAVNASMIISAIAVAPGYRDSLVTNARYLIGSNSVVFVQGNYATPQGPGWSNVTVTYPNIQFAGDVNVVVVGWNDSTATVAAGGVTDSMGNTYTLAVGPTVLSGSLTQSIYYAKNILGAAAGANTVTVNFSSPANAPDVRILEYGGLSGTVDVTAAASGSTSNSTVGITTANPSDLIVGANIVHTITTGPGPGFTSRMITNPDGDIAEDMLVSTTGTYTASAPVSPAGGWIMQAVAFKVGSTNPAPTVTAISPTSGTTNGGTSVTITGTGFLSGASVTLGGTAATSPNVVNSTTITATTPAHVVGAVNVVVANTDGQSGTLTNGFTYVSPNPAPTVTSIAPTSGTTAGGTSVTITGTGFLSGASVTLGGTAATSPNVVNSTTLTATTPAHAAGAVNVVVTNTDGQSGTLSNGYTYVSANPAPTVTSVAPTSGTIAGGTSVTITGTGFLSGASVSFGGTAATNPSVVNSTTITAATPAHAAGAVNVVVTNTDGQSGTLTNGYTYSVPVSATLVQHAEKTVNAGTNTTSQAFPAASTSGDLIVVTVKWGNQTISVSSITDNKGNTYTSAVGPTNWSGTTKRAQTFYAKNIVGGGTPITITVNLTANSTSSLHLYQFEYANADTVSPLDVTSAAIGNSTTLNSGTATTHLANELIYGAAFVDNGNSSPGSGFVAETRFRGNLVEDKNVSSLGTYNATATDTTSSNWVIQMAAFKVAGQGSNPPPTVTSIAPTAGPISGGTSVTITGTGLVSGATVSFGGTAATNPNVVNSTTMTATTAAHAAGAVNVVVTNPDSQSGTLTNGYTYNPPPTVTSIAPTAGSINGGTSVTITGTGFLSGATVSIGGAAATNPNVVNSTTMTATTAAHAAGAVNVVVTNTDGQSGTRTNGYTYNPAPAVSSILPTSGTTAGGTSVTITGTGFLSGATATIGGTAATNPNVVNSTTMTATTAAHTAGAVNVVVTNTDGQNGTLTNGYTYTSPNPAPTVSSILPTSGPAAGGTSVTITGTGFLSGATASIGGVATTNPNVVNSTTMTATTAARAAGTVNVVVTNTDGQSGTLTNGYTYNPAPTVSSVAPNAGSINGGTSVTITGTGFVSGASVSFGGTAATNPSVVNSTTMTATTPAHAAGAVNVVVTNPDSQSGTRINGYTYNPAPTVTSIAPTSGTTAGGTSVTITGTGFLTSATVTLGGTAPTNVTVVSSTSITATTPAHALGAVNVVVTNTDGQSGTLTNGYTYVNPAPTVTAIAPNSGPTAGGTAVTITGTGFLTNATVTLGGTAATSVTVVSSTSITATTPAHAAGTVSVVVTNTGGQSGTLTNGFTYGSVAISFAQVAAATPQSPVSTLSIAYPAAQTAGDLNVVVVGWNDSTSNVTGITDTAGNTYQLAIGPTRGTGISQSIYYATNIKAGSNTVTVTFNQAAAFVDLRILEYKGIVNPAPLDVTAGAAGSSTTSNSGATTTTAANELIVAANTVNTAATGAGTGYTLRIITSPDADLVEDRTAATAGSYSATAPVSPSGAWVMQMVTFKSQ